MKIDNFKANGFKWDEKQLVEEVLDNLPQDKAVELTKQGFKNIEIGKPVYAQRFEQGPKHNLKLADLRKIVKPHGLSKQD